MHYSCQSATRIMAAPALSALSCGLALQHCSAQVAILISALPLQSCQVPLQACHLSVQASPLCCVLGLAVGQRLHMHHIICLKQNACKIGMSSQALQNTSPGYAKCQPCSQRTLCHFEGLWKPYLLFHLSLCQEPVLLCAQLTNHASLPLLGCDQKGFLALQAACLGFHLPGFVSGCQRLRIKSAQLLLQIVHQHLCTDS